MFLFKCINIFNVIYVKKYYLDYNIETLKPF